MFLEVIFTVKVLTDSEVSQQFLSETAARSCYQLVITAAFSWPELRLTQPRFSTKDLIKTLIRSHFCGLKEVL